MKPFLIALCLVLVLVALGQPGQGPYPNGVFGGPGGSHVGGGPTSPGGSNNPINSLVVDVWFNPSASANATVVVNGMLPADFVIGVPGSITSLTSANNGNSTMYVTNVGRIQWPIVLSIGGTNYTDTGTKAYANVLGHAGAAAKAVFNFNLNANTNISLQGFYTTGQPADANFTGQDIWEINMAGHFAIMQIHNGGGPGNYGLDLETDPGGVTTFSPVIHTYQGEQLFCSMRVDELDGTTTLVVQDAYTGYVMGQVTQASWTGNPIDSASIGNGSGSFNGGNNVDCLGSILFNFDAHATQAFYTLNSNLFLGYNTEITNFLHNSLVGDGAGNGSAVSWQTLSNLNVMVSAFKVSDGGGPSFWTELKLVAPTCGFQKNGALTLLKYPVGVSPFMAEDSSHNITYSEHVGLTGTSSTFIDSGYNPVTQSDSPTNFEMSAVVTTTTSTGVQLVDMGNDFGDGKSDNTWLGWNLDTGSGSTYTMGTIRCSDITAGTGAFANAGANVSFTGLRTILAFLPYSGNPLLFDSSGFLGGTSGPFSSFHNNTFGLMASHSGSSWSHNSSLTYTYFDIGTGMTDIAGHATIVNAFNTAEGR